MIRSIAIILAAILACSYSLCLAQFTGGSGSGYGTVELLTDFSIYEGGTGQGSALLFSTSDKSIYDGGSGHGQSQAVIEASTTIYKGGSNDGYDEHLRRYQHFWNGQVSSLWNEPANWNGSFVPDSSMAVVIPVVDTMSGHFFPKLLFGTLRINQPAMTANYECRSLTITADAKLILGGTVQTYNQGNLRIKGRYISDGGDFFNRPGGQLIIGSGGKILMY